MSTVYPLQESESVSCYYCLRQQNHTNYQRGEAFLADAGHSPGDGNANYICTQHLDEDAVITESPFATKEPTCLPENV